MENSNPLVTYNEVYTTTQENLIQKEFSRLEGQCYLEHAGTTLYSEKQIKDILSDLEKNTFGNPHARNNSSKLTEDAIDQIRYMILQHFNTTPEDYSVIFTSGTTSSLKLVAEYFRYHEEDNTGGEEEEQGTFVYLQDNHTSVLGMREYAKKVFPLPHDTAFRVFSNYNSHSPNNKEETREKINSLFVYPAQCNYSGVKYPLSWIENVQKGVLNSLDEINNSKNWFCLLDAASFVSTNFLNLSIYKPDFVCLSFYKIFGYPTGLGGLLVKNSSAHVLSKKYFGGGTVLMALPSEKIHVLRPVIHERFEDGTPPFLQILSLRHGFDTLKRFKITMQDISNHTFSLAKYVYQSLITLHHENGKPVAVVYHDTNYEDVKYQGGIVNFNLLRESGEYIGYAEVLHISNLYNVHLRTGCFCNPGACQRHLKLTPQDVKQQFNAGHVCGDENDLVNGYPTGSVRISFGYMSTKTDANVFLKMIEECFVTKPIIRKFPENWPITKFKCLNKFKTQLTKGINPDSETFLNATLKNSLKISNRSNIWNDNINSNNSDYEGTLQQIFIYPIKSCAAFEISTSWELINTGFKYDRQWMIINSSGVCVTQKTDIRLCLIKPEIDLKRALLYLHHESLQSISVPLHGFQSNRNVSLSKCQSKVCGDRIQGWDCGDEVANWLVDALGILGLRLLRQCTNPNETKRTSKNEEKSQLSLANQAQFLLINSASVQWLLDRIPENEFSGDLQNLIGRFRPNFVVNFRLPFLENSFSMIQIGQFLFKCDGNCTRCQMICINQSTGEKSVEPLRTLSKEFKGKITFGIYLSNIQGNQNYCKLHINDHAIGFLNNSVT